MASIDKFGPYRSARRPSSARSEDAISLHYSQRSRLRDSGEGQTARPAPPTGRDAWLATITARADAEGPRPGAPPRTGKPPNSSNSAFLNAIVEKITQRQLDASDPAMRPARAAPELFDTEGLKDQLYQLKKELLAFRMERELLRAKVHQLERECRARESEIEQLSTSNPAASLGATSARAEDSRLVTALKQQVRELRAQVEERNAAVGALENDLRSTNADELRLVAATQFQELERLRVLLEQPSGDGAENLADPTGQHSMPLAAALRDAKEEVKSLLVKNKQLTDELKQAKDLADVAQRDLDGHGVDPDLAQAFPNVRRGELMTRLRAAETEASLLREQNASLSNELSTIIKHNKELPFVAERMETLTARQAELIAAKEAAIIALNEERQRLLVLAEQERQQVAQDLRSKELPILEERERELQSLRIEREQLRGMTAKALEEMRAAEALAAEHARLVAETERERKAAAQEREKHLKDLDAERRSWLAKQQQELRQPKGKRTAANLQGADLDALVRVQSALRGHLARLRLKRELGSKNAPEMVPAVERRSVAGRITGKGKADSDEDL
jgi:hypothetical protein